MEHPATHPAKPSKSGKRQGKIAADSTSLPIYL